VRDADDGRPRRGPRGSSSRPCRRRPSVSLIRPRPKNTRTTSADHQDLERVRCSQRLSEQPRADLGAFLGFSSGRLGFVVGPRPRSRRVRPDRRRRRRPGRAARRL
jgi:hypothetical protein